MKKSVVILSLLTLTICGISGCKRYPSDQEGVEL